MEEDDVLPNDGTYFFPREPRDQSIARKKERAQTLADLNILKEIVEHLDLRVAFYSSIDAIPVEVKTDPTKFMNMTISNQMTRDNLRAEKEYIESIIELARAR